MKRTYIAPSAIRIELATEGMMAQSLGWSSSETVTDESNVLSTERNGWSADNWNGADED
ncbi:MAG: hypothetical protein PUI06_01700 [Prevotella sp.]|nr:hypothetical protein [Prevotella sp.]MDY5665996.1 hypothetical protein [Alloprevotella sp.]